MVRSAPSSRVGRRKASRNSQSKSASEFTPRREDIKELTAIAMSETDVKRPALAMQSTELESAIRMHAPVAQVLMPRFVTLPGPRTADVLLVVHSADHFDNVLRNPKLPRAKLLLVLSCKLALSEVAARMLSLMGSTIVWPAARSATAQGVVRADYVLSDACRIGALFLGYRCSICKILTHALSKVRESGALVP